MRNPTKEYLFLFNTVTNLAQSLEELRNQLIAAQRDAEELYLLEEDDPEKR